MLERTIVRLGGGLGNASLLAEDLEMEIEGQREQVHLVGVDKSGRLALLRDGKLQFFGIKTVKFLL